MTDNTVLIVEDDEPLKDALVSTLEEAGYGVLAAADGGEAMRILGDAPVDLVVTDVQMTPVDGHELLRRMTHKRPDIPVLMMTAYGTIDQAVAAMRGGAVDYLVKPFEAEELRERVARYVRSRAATDHDDAPLAVDPTSQALMSLAARVAGSDVTVLLTGESGTGKEVIARFIHGCSARSAGPFVAINCAAIPDQMLEALLFGYEKGSFTGAQARSDGKLVQANSGTLLLDEITEMDLGLQAKLLRVLQEREVEPLGASAPTALNVRVLATTNRDLEEAVRDGQFREDLYYRLNVFPLNLPPLRQRPGDILPLARRFIAKACTPQPAAPQLSASACAELESFSWPGNVRQLENVIQRALVLHGGGAWLEAEHFALEGDPSVRPSAQDLSGELWAEETRRIVEALRSSGGSRKLAAERLGISPRTLRYKLSKIREAGIQIPDRGVS
jgi:two-component system response regulator FlrC